MKRSFLIFIIGLSVLVYACKVAQKSLPLDANGQIIVNINPSQPTILQEKVLKLFIFQKDIILTSLPLSL